MKKKISVTSLFLILFLLCITNNAYAQNKRLAGRSRYETSASIVKDGWQKSDYAIIASGEGFADALSAAPLAKKHNAPIILTEGKQLNPNAKSELQRLGVKNVIIVGGTGAISNTVEHSIKALNINVRRLCGISRYDTSLEVAKELGTNNGLVIANGNGFADALSIAPIAANKQMPIILTPTNDLPQNTKNFLQSNSNYNKSYIIGGSAIVNDKIKNTIKNPTRLYGSNRYDTNAAILNHFKDELDLSKVYVAAGNNYPDALSVSALAGINNSPVLLADSSVNKNVLKFAYDNNCKINDIVVAGGSAIISDVVIKTIQEGKQINPLRISYINVRQGDSILIQQDGHNMLIDAGTNESTNTVINYLRSQGVSKLDYVIATHPHADHIGGMTGVINNFSIDKFIMPNVTHTSQTFRNMIIALKNKNIKITLPNVGDNYSLGYANFTILAPNNAKYDNLNNYSVATKLKFGNRSFVFTGDAEALSEGEILAKQLDISADVLKLGHHGSKTSTTLNFLNKVNPKFAIVSCGKDNKYRHPNQATLNKLKSKNITVYRTDQNGTVVATTNGTNLSFNVKPGNYIGGDYVAPKPVVKPTPKPRPRPSYKPVQKPTLSTVYITKSGKKFHRAGCSSLRRSCIPINRQTAISRGYGACRKCHP